jgi:hypothetical protein
MLFQVARSWGICALIGGCVADKKADWNLGLYSGTNIQFSSGGRQSEG